MNRLKLTRRVQFATVRRPPISRADGLGMGSKPTREMRNQIFIQEQAPLWRCGTGPCDGLSYRFVEVEVPNIETMAGIEALRDLKNLIALHYLQ
jgi:hypothetical protein